MASTDADQLQGMRANFRSYSGLNGTDEIADASADILLNDFYVGSFMDDIHHDSFKVDFTQDVSVDDDGEYDLDGTVIDLDGRVTYNGYALKQYFTKEEFFQSYPDCEDYVTAPALSTGTSNAAHVKNAAFAYEITGQSYTKASAETALSGDTVPQSKYGAWALTIDINGDITVTEASNNATGYDSPGLAVNAIPGLTDAIMGYVTVIDSDSTFIPGTTELSSSGVTATYTDGNPGFRMAPESFLVDGRKLFIRPKSDDKGQIKAPLQIERPDDLSGDSATVFSEKMGKAISIGTAAEYWSSRGDTEKAMQLTGNEELPGTYKYLITRINRDWYKQQSKRPNGSVA